jgi:hypothetical protein
MIQYFGNRRLHVFRPDFFIPRWRCLLQVSPTPEFSPGPGGMPGEWAFARAASSFWDRRCFLAVGMPQAFWPERRNPFRGEVFSGHG